ncbi:uncharacterized protein LOC118823876 [Colossoma macropomum]|uniref:uncharacterized protein LOC118823876 n=1 Tax=Colossoma macropomum TaxID=42526 RepID=UPI00186498AB|nr:uncharacterized protein LOC118823876 [Colossoma macropomum]
MMLLKRGTAGKTGLEQVDAAILDPLTALTHFYLYRLTEELLRKKFIMVITQLCWFGLLYTVADPLGRYVGEYGCSVLLPLHPVSPVIVRFLPVGGNGSVRVCEVEKEQTECGAAYSHRTELQQHFLELRNLSMEDTGLFFVVERETQHGVSFLFIKVFPPSTDTSSPGPPNNFDNVRNIIIVICIFVGLLVLSLIVRCVRWCRRRRDAEEYVVYFQNY